MMEEFPRIAVVGSRDFFSQDMVERFVYLLPRKWTIVSGGARGVDKWAEQTAKHHRRHTDIYEPDWKKYGKVAGFIRNNEIVRNCDIVVAFWDGRSKGTKHSIQLARYLNKPCIIVKGQGV
jgi:hypothetical protein